MDVNSSLKEIGLDDNEIKVYLSCLSNNGQNVKDISKRTELIRTTVYGVLKTLMQKGLVSTVDKEGIMVFRAASPNELLNILDMKREKLKDAIPELLKYSNFMPAYSKVEFFEGRAGVKTITNDIISKPDEVVKVMGIGAKWMSFSDSFTAVYYRKKAEQNVKTKTILCDTKEERKFFSDKKYKNSDIRFLKNFDFKDTVTYIYQDKVSFVVYSEDNPRGFVISDKDFNRLQNMLFDDLWEKTTK